MKVFGKWLLCSVLVFGASAEAANHPVSAASNQIVIMLDGYPLPLPTNPVAIQGTTMVPFRAISESLGITVSWDQKTRTITAMKQSGEVNTQVVLTLGKKSATVNGQTVTLRVAPQTIQNNTMIPLSFFSQQFGATVGWNQSTQTVSITSPQKDLYTLGFYALSSFDERSFIPNFDSIAFGWSRLDSEGNFTVSGKEYKWPQPAGDITPESIIQDTADQGTAPYLMVYSGDGNLEITKVLEDKTLQEKTISQIVSTASEQGFQGIVLDLEGLGLTGDKAKVKADFNAFINKISSAARSAGLKLTLVLHPLNSSYSGYEYKTLGSLADDLIIMAYAYEQEKSPEPLAKVDEAIRLALKEVNKDKLILGISVASENDQSINSKIGLAKRYDLKGIAIWRLGIIGQAKWDKMNQSLVME